MALGLSSKATSRPSFQRRRQIGAELCWCRARVARNTPKRFHKQNSAIAAAVSGRKFPDVKAPRIVDGEFGDLDHFDSRVGKRFLDERVRCLMLKVARRRRYDSQFIVDNGPKIVTPSYNGCFHVCLLNTLAHRHAHRRLDRLLGCLQ